MARVSLKLSSDEFFQLTPRQYWLLERQLESEREYEESLHAQTTAMIAHVLGGADYDPFQFMPTFQRKQKPKREKKMSLDDKFRAFFSTFTPVATVSMTTEPSNEATSEVPHP